MNPDFSYNLLIIKRTSDEWETRSMPHLSLCLCWWLTIVSNLWDLVNHLLDGFDFSLSIDLLLPHKAQGIDNRSENTLHAVVDAWLMELDLWPSGNPFASSFWRHFKRFCEVWGYVFKVVWCKKLLKLVAGCLLIQLWLSVLVVKCGRGIFLYGSMVFLRPHPAHLRWLIKLSAVQPGGGVSLVVVVCVDSFLWTRPGARCIKIDLIFVLNITLTCHSFPMRD